MRPRLKSYTRERVDGGILLRRDSSVVRLDDDDGSREALLPLLDGSRTIAEIALAVRRAEDKVAADVAALAAEGLLEDAAAANALTAAEHDRYAGNLAFFGEYAGVDISRFDFQERLREAHVLVLGAGGIGSMVLMHLAGLGVGRVTIVDFDRVEPRNLNRQFLYGEHDVGRPKLEAAAARVRAQNAGVDVRTVELRVERTGDVEALLDDVDLVISAIDHPADVQDRVNEACVRAGTPFVTGGVQAAQGIYYSVAPGRSGCLACWRRLQERATGDRPARVNRATGPSVGVLGSLIAFEAMRYLTGFAPPASAGRLWAVDWATGEVRVVFEWRAHPECVVCGGTVETPSDAHARVAPESRLRFRPLSIVQEGEEYIVGNVETGVFLSIPEIGVVALRELQAGRTIAEAAAAATARAGENVNVLEFAEALLESGLVTGVDVEPAEGDIAAREPVRAALATRIARPLFAPAAWAVYALLLIASAAVFVLRPDAWPSFEDLFFYPNPAVSAIGITVTTLAVAALHELAHWLGARVAGVGASFSVGRRLFMPVFETDLSQLWSVPRRRRYGAFLAGMAFNTVLLAACLGLRLAWAEGWLDLPPLLLRYLGALVLLNLLGLVFQTLVFARTDLYAVLITALGCRNLSRVNALYLRERLGMLRERERGELEAAHARDRDVARWFSVLYLVGIAVSAWYFVEFFVPGTVVFAGWMFHALGGAPLASPRFWEAFAVGALAAVQALWPLAVYVRERALRRRPVGA